MHEFASLNYRIESASKSYLPIVSAAAFYGRSIFTTIAAYQTEIFQWEKHWQRLNENAARLSIDLSKFSEKEIRAAISDLIRVNNFGDGRIRITFFDKTERELWSLKTEEKTVLLITTADFQKSPGEMRLTISPFLINSASPLINIKSGNYLENILALEESRHRNFDEAVRVNERGEVVSAIMANLFLVKDKTIYTSPLETGALRGTTREFIKENFQIIEKIITPAELKLADEIFITSAGIGIAKVKSFEDKIFQTSNISNNIQKDFDSFTRKKGKSKIPS